ncbi:MAG: SDR family oxidoreductase [Acidobacteriia bacterium]|nr:SDR family oxidoreductase [Terriglobia bacterium]
MVSPFSLAGKTALVTGASRGIGLAIARSMREAGAEVILAARSKEKLEAAAAEIGGRVLELDIADPESIVRAAAEVGEVDILANVAGMNIRGRAEDYTQDQYNRIMQTNLHGLFQLTQLIGKKMITRGAGGKIINIGSFTTFTGLPYVSVYAMTKGAVGQLTKVLAAEWACHNIQVNCIAPGFILTDLNRAMWQSEAMDGWRKGIQAIDRLGCPEDISPLAVFLAAPGSDYITGQVIAVDGGATTTAKWPVTTPNT